MPRDRMPPIGRYHHQRIKHETPFSKARVRHGKAGQTQLSSAGSKNIEIQHPIPPALPAPAAKVPLDIFQRTQKIRQAATPLQSRHRIGITAAARADRGRREDGRYALQQPQPRQCRQRRAHHARRPAMAAVAAVRSQRDKYDCHIILSPYRHR